MNLRRYKKNKFRIYISRVIILFIISICLAFVVINYFAKKANDILLPMAESQVRKVVTMIINSACDESEISNNLYTINKNANNEIEMINYNSFEATRLINEVTFNVEKKLREFEKGNMNYYGEKKLQDGGVVSEIPFGVIFDNPFLANLGPKIKLRLNLLGDIISNIETEVKPYGINNAYVEVRIYLEVTARIVLPFVTEKISISNVIPISISVVQGTIPDAYISSYR